MWQDPGLISELFADERLADLFPGSNSLAEGPPLHGPDAVHPPFEQEKHTASTPDPISYDGKLLNWKSNLDVRVHDRAIVTLRPTHGKEAPDEDEELDDDEPREVVHKFRDVVVHVVAVEPRGEPGQEEVWVLAKYGDKDIVFQSKRLKAREPEFPVEHILAQCWGHAGTQYLVKWLHGGYTWEPWSHLDRNLAALLAFQESPMKIRTRRHAEARVCRRCENPWLHVGHTCEWHGRKRSRHE